MKGNRSHENRKRLRASTSFPQNIRARTATATTATTTTNNTPSLASLQSALEANRQLQQVLRQQLLQVHERQYENRQAVSRILKQQDMLVLQRNTDSSSAATTDDTTVASATPKQVQEFFASSLQDDANTPTTNPPALGRSVAAKFKYQPTRKWTLAYFVDPTGSKPRPNPDALERQAWRETAFLECTMTPAEKDDSNNNSNNNNNERTGKRGRRKKTTQDSMAPLARPESLRLFQLVHEKLNAMQQQQQQQQQQSDTNEALDWHEIASDLSQDAASKQQRSAWECFCHYRQVLEPQTAPSALVHQPPLDPQQDELLFRYLALQGPQFVWDSAQAHHVATRLFPNVRVRNLLQRSNQTAALNPNLLAWSSLSGNNADGDKEEDGNEETTSTFWKAKAERKLVLLMKMYQQEEQESPSAENGNDEEDGNDEDNDEDDLATKPKASSSRAPRSSRTSSHTSDMPKVAAHFPDRTRQQVSHKWERSLDPQLDHSLFSPQEDALLLETMREAAAATHTSKGAAAPSFQGFRNVANQHFPHRKPHQVYARWLEIAPPEEWKTYQSSMILLQRRGISNSSSNSTKGKGDDDSSVAGALLHPDDVRLERYSNTS